MPATTTRGVPYPEATDNNNTPADLQALAEWVDAAPGIAVVTTTQRDALLVWVGRHVWNTTTGQLERWNGAAWVPGVDAIPSSLVDAAGDLLVGAGPDAIERLAAGAEGQVLTVQPDGTLAWGNATSAVFISASEMHESGGAPSRSSVSNVAPAWAMDSASLERVSGILFVPDGWTSANVTLYWTNLGVGAGDVRWRLDYNLATDGDTIGLTSAAAGTQTAPAQNVVETVSLAAGLAVTAGEMLSLGVLRFATDAADTLPNDAGIIGLLVEKAA